MNEYLIIKFLHIVGFAYWLGGDLGVFHSSYYVADPKQPPAVRIAAAKILFWLDQIPRICMTMMLPLGVHLAWKLNLLPITGTIMAVIWLACFGWLAMVFVLHAMQPSPKKQLLTTFDFWFRLVLSLSLLGIGIGSLAAGLIALPHWVAAKLAIFGGLVGLGLIIRIKLKDFGPAFGNIASGNGTEADDAAIQQSLGGTRPFVVAIWIGLLASAAFGLHLF